MFDGIDWSVRGGSCFAHATRPFAPYFLFSHAQTALILRACPGRPRICSSGASPLVPTTKEIRHGASSPGKMAIDIPPYGPELGLLGCIRAAKGTAVSSPDAGSSGARRVTVCFALAR